MSLRRVIEALEAAGLRPTGAELADALWLAQHLDPAPAVEAPAARPRPAVRHAPAPVPRPTPPAPEEPAQARVRDEPVRAEPLPAAPVRTPGVPALPTAVRLTRCLRPLKRRLPSPRDTELDEEATARRFAETGRWHPVCRPVRTRWLDVALVVDADPAMVIWRRLTEELAAAIARAGAFRDVRRWFLHHHDDRLGLSPAAGTPSGLRDPAELIDPTGRRIILVVSGGLGPAWDTGAIAPLLDRYGRAGPTALVSPLPQRLWDRTALRARLGTVAPTRPGAANTLLRYVPRGEDDGLAAGEVPVPLLELSPSWLSGWARLVAGAGPEDVAIGTLAPPPAPVPARSPRDRVARFRRHASVEAFELLRHLAVVPLSIPVMRLVQHATAAAPDPAHLAEVYLSGLLEPVGADDDTDDDTVAFEFAAGVRDVLLGLLRRTEATHVLTAVGEVIDTHPNGSEFTAYLPTDECGRPVPLAGEPFAEVAGHVLRRLRAPLDPHDRAALAAANRPPSGEGWQDTIRRTADGLYQHLLGLLDNPGDAEDAVQEVYVNAMEQGEPTDDAHLYAIADDIAHQRRRYLVWFQAPEPTDAEDTVVREDLATLRDAAAGLPKEQRRVMEALLDAGPTDEARLAGRLGMSLERFALVRKRARRSIRQAVAALRAARDGQDRCPDLATVCRVHLTEEQTRADRLVLTPDQTRRIQQHVRSCPRCARFTQSALGDW